MKSGNITEKKNKTLKEKTVEPNEELIASTEPVSPLKFLTSWTYKRPSGDYQGTDTKIDELMTKLFFRNNSNYITDLLLFFTRRINI